MLLLLFGIDSFLFSCLNKSCYKILQVWLSVHGIFQLSLALKIVTCVHICVFSMCLCLLVRVPVRMCVEVQAFTGCLSRLLSSQMEAGSLSVASGSLSYI